MIGLPWWLIGKESACQCRRHGFPGLGRSHILWNTTTIELVSEARELQLLSPQAETAEALAP